ncbi:hypothetical protein [Ensifer sp. B1-9]|uniref:hypothetical protein n=1 Tax=Ensifer sp. B1-9 TaxID=3141455 RepID=UPI003D210C5B
MALSSSLGSLLEHLLAEKGGCPAVLGNDPVKRAEEAERGLGAPPFDEVFEDHVDGRRMGQPSISTEPAVNDVDQGLGLAGRKSGDRFGAMPMNILIL